MQVAVGPLGRGLVAVVVVRSSLTRDRPTRACASFSTAASQLAHRQRALEPLDDPAVALDHERPRLGRQPPRGDLRAEALLDVVVVVDLLVDERRRRRSARGPRRRRRRPARRRASGTAAAWRTRARPAPCRARRRGPSRAARRSGGMRVSIDVEVAADVLERVGVHADRLVADVGRPARRAGAHLDLRRRDDLAVDLRERGDDVAAAAAGTARRRPRTCRRRRGRPASGCDWNCGLTRSDSLARHERPAQPAPVGLARRRSRRRRASSCLRETSNSAKPMRFSPDAQRRRRSARRRASPARRRAARGSSCPRRCGKSTACAGPGASPRRWSTELAGSSSPPQPARPTSSARSRAAEPSRGTADHCSVPPPSAMPDRAAIVTGASSGIGFAVADVLGAGGLRASRWPPAAPRSSRPRSRSCEGKGYDVQHVAGNLGDEEDIKRVVDAHRDALRPLRPAREQRGRRDRRARRRADDEEARHPAQHELPLDPALLPRGARHAARGRRRAPQRARRQHVVDLAASAARRGCRSTAPPSTPSSASRRR